MKLTKISVVIEVDNNVSGAVRFHLSLYKCTSF